MSSTTIWKVGPASVGVLSPCKTSESKLCLQETVHCSCSFNACLPRPQTSILALAPWTCPLQKLNGLQVSRQQQRWFVLSRQSQLWKRGSRRSTMVNSDRAMPCRSIGHTSRSLHPPVRSNSKFLRRSIRLSMLACNSHLREKLKSPKPSLREDISPPRYTANNEKCNESQSGSASGALCLAPFRTLTHALPVFMQVIYFDVDEKNLVQGGKYNHHEL